MKELFAALDAIDGDAWLVGGAVRDRLLGRETTDFDIAVRDDVARIARAVGRAAGGHPFSLSEAFGGWRVVARDGSWQLDVLPLAGETIEDDLSRRDLTINAIAEPLGGGEAVDPFGGRADLAARRLRMVSKRAFEDDPLRTLRVARLACELGFEAEPETVAVARASAPALERVSPERIFAEVRRLLCAEAARSGVEQMEALGATAVVLPELLELKGVEQSRFHHLDVHEHTLAVLDETIALSADPAAVFGAELSASVAAVLSEPLADGLTRGEALRFGALLHDIAKPQTRGVRDDGRITFMGHDRLGADVSREILTRWRASERLREHVASLALHHLRLGFLVHDVPLPRRTVYAYLEKAGAVGVDVTVLSAADRLATQGEGAERATERHLALAREMLGEALQWRTAPPQPPIRGDELARALGVKPGPDVGRLLAELSQASWAGELSGREQAIARARELLDRVPRR